jgi:Flp pilus assembly protein TadG
MRLDTRRLNLRPRATVPGSGPATDARERSRGQSLVEFSLVLVPLMLLLLGIIQFGFIFNSYVTLANASREAAREGSIYVYDRNLTRSANDLARNERMRTTFRTALNNLVATAPNFTNSGTWTSSTSNGVVTFVTGDLSIAYERPTNVADTDPRRGYRITVRATYRQDLFLPLITGFLSLDANGRLALTGVSTMVVN